MIELKWLVPVATGVAIAIYALVKPQATEMAWSRAFVIVAALLMSFVPLIASASLTPGGGLQLVTANHAVGQASDAVKKLDERLSANEKAMADFQRYIAELKVIAPTAEAKARIDSSAKALADSVEQTVIARQKLEPILKDLHDTVQKMPTPKT
jgi:hypothetical protein